VKIAIGCDHGGQQVKDAVRQELEGAGIDVLDLSPPGESDYPDVAEQVAEAVVSGDATRGVLVCGTGIGMSITANKIDGVRAALCADPYSARMSREHNDANVLCLGGRTLGVGAATEILRAWIAAQPSTEERHVRRRAKVTQIERAGATARR
jgi:ribose 5-phosphate isomerase B